MGGAARQTGYSTGPRIHKNARAVHHCGILRRSQRHLDYIYAKQRCVRIFVGRVTRTSCQLLALTDEGSAGHVDVDVVLIIRIDDQRVRVRAAASLHRGDLLRRFDVGDIEYPNAAETIFLRGR